MELNGGQSLITLFYHKMETVWINLWLWITQVKNKNIAHYETCNHFTCVSQIYGSVATQNIFDCWEMKCNMFTAPHSLDDDKENKSDKKLKWDSVLKEKFNGIWVPCLYTYLREHGFPKIKHFASQLRATFCNIQFCEYLLSLMKRNELQEIALNMWDFVVNNLSGTKAKFKIRYS
jgi:hypothetical protein